MPLVVLLDDEVPRVVLLAEEPVDDVADSNMVRILGVLVANIGETSASRDSRSSSEGDTVAELELDPFTTALPSEYCRVSSATTISTARMWLT